MNKLVNDGDPWSPVDLAEYARESRVSSGQEEPELEVKGGNVTAHINLGSAPAEEEEPPAEEEEAEAALAEKLAALDAAKSGKKTKR